MKVLFGTGSFRTAAQVYQATLRIYTENTRIIVPLKGKGQPLFTSELTDSFLRISHAFCMQYIKLRGSRISIIDLVYDCIILHQKVYHAYII